MKPTLVIILALLCAARCAAQGRCAAAASRDVNLSVEADRTKHPLRVIVEPVDANLLGRPVSRFRAGDSVRLRVSLFNASAGSVWLPDIGSEYRQYRLYLMKGRQTLPYRDGLCEELKELDAEFSAGSMGRIDIAPGGTAEAVSFLDLGRWYGPLKPGRYRLRLERRFWFAKSLPAVEAEPVAFEVVP